MSPSVLVAAEVTLQGTIEKWFFLKQADFTCVVVDQSIYLTLNCTNANSQTHFTSQMSPETLIITADDLGSIFCRSISVVRF